MNVNSAVPPTQHRTHAALGFAGWLVLCFAAAALGGFFLPGEWYAQLRKPSWNPPGWIFGPVWTALYTMMAVAAWLVWRRGGFAAQRVPLGLFLLQLLLNAAWSPLFFGLHHPALAFVEIVMLWLAILATVLAIHLGFNAVVLLALLLYGAAAVVFPHQPARTAGP